jgi:RNA recognition motif-containing protein
MCSKGGKIKLYLTARQFRRTSFFATRICIALKSKGRIMKNIYVGNLSFQTTEQEIRSLFEAHGSVDRVNIVTDRDTGQPRGFAFVEMTNNAEGDRAIEAVNGKDVGGRTLNVNEARPKSEGGGGGRGYAGGGGGRRNSGGGGRGRY